MLDVVGEAVDTDLMQLVGRARARVRRRRAVAYEGVEHAGSVGSVEEIVQVLDVVLKTFVK